MRLGHRVMYYRLYAELPQLRHDVWHAAVAQVWHVLLEGEPQDADARFFDGLDIGVDQQLDEPLRQELSHTVVHGAAGQDHLRVVAYLLRLGGEVVGVHADAVSAHQARAEGEEVP